MRFNQDPAQWVARITRRRDETEQVLRRIEWVCESDRSDLSATMRLALAMMAIRDAEYQQAAQNCDFSDLLACVDLQASDPGLGHQTT